MFDGRRRNLVDVGAAISVETSRRPSKRQLNLVEETPDIDFRRRRRLVERIGEN